jgi:hypothetical protein
MNKKQLQLKEMQWEVESAAQEKLHLLLQSNQIRGHSIREELNLSFQMSMNRHKNSLL